MSANKLQSPVAFGKLENAQKFDDNSSSLQEKICNWLIRCFVIIFSLNKSIRSDRLDSIMRRLEEIAQKLEANSTI